MFLFEMFRKTTPFFRLLALAVVIVHAFRPVVIRLYVAHLFCLVFSKKFNIMSALSAHQAHTLPQKIDSREGCFDAKKG